MYISCICRVKVLELDAFVILVVSDLPSIFQDYLNCFYRVDFKKTSCGCVGN
jgi:hypothetical protein